MPTGSLYRYGVYKLYMNIYITWLHMLHLASGFLVQTHYATCDVMFIPIARTPKNSMF